MKQLVIASLATLAIGSAAAQAPQQQVFATGQAAPPAVVVRADAGVVQVEGNAAIPLTRNVAAEAGDTITVARGSRATLTYADGCVVSIGQSMQVGPVSPCKAGLVKGDAAGWTQGQMLAAGFGAVVVGALAAGGGGGGSDRPSSP